MLNDLNVKNYKSLRDITFEGFPRFSVFIGANAAGKSNFADALDFLSLVFRGGLAHAVRTKGGFYNICFRRARRARGAIEFSVSTVTQWPGVAAEYRRSKFKFAYHFAFRASSRAIGSDYAVTAEEFTVTHLDSPYGSFNLSRVANQVSTHKTGAIDQINPMLAEPYFERFVRPEASHRFEDDELIVPEQFYFALRSGLDDLLEGCRVYQISPHMARQTGVPEPNAELGRHGENLPAAVEYLRRRNPRAMDELMSHLSHTVPTITRLDTQYVETKQLGLFFTEKGVGSRWFSQDVSDGTIQTVALFLSLLDRRVTMAVIEEPENSIHPWILRHFVDVCKETSVKKQIILTTQSPVVVNEVPLDSLFICERTEGETTIIPVRKLYPEADQVLKETLLGLGDYWNTGALGAIPMLE